MREAKPNRHAREIIRHKTYRTSESHRRQVEIKFSKRKQCNKKRRYETKEQAQAACMKIRTEVVFQVTPLKPYYCLRHQLWHIGHSGCKYHNKEKRKDKIKQEHNYGTTSL